MTTPAAQFIGSIPENYDKGLGPRIFNGYADDLARRVAGLRPRSVLEMAAGTGIVTRRLRDLLARDCDLLSTDLNEPMLEVAKAKFGADEPVRFEQADALDLRFEDARFDVVACQFGVMFFPDKGRSYAQVHRVLKPGGSYIFNVWDSWGANPYAEVAHNAVAEFFSDDPPGFYRIPFGYHDADEISSAVTGAGFADVAVERVSLISKIPSARDFAQGLVFGNPLHEEIVTRGGDPEAVRAAVTRAIERHLGSEMSLQALVVQASKAGSPS